MSVNFNNCIVKGFSGNYNDIEGLDTGISFINGYEQDISLLVKSKFSALSEISFDNEDNLHETTISFAPKINFKQSFIMPEITNFSLE